MEPRSGAVLALVVVGLAGAPAAGAAGIHTGTIEVTGEGDLLETAAGTVRALHLATGRAREQPTGTGSSVVFSALPPGRYRVRLELPGLAPASEEIELHVGQTVRVTLAPRIEEVIEVRATPTAVDVYRLDTSTNILPEQVEQLPVPDRDFQNLAFIAPGVQRERGSFRFIQGAPVIGSAGNASLSAVFVDGADLTDPALGLARVRLSQEAIREFRVVTHRFDSEIGGSAGGVLTVVTHSGGNTPQGRTFGFWRDQALREPGALEREEADFSRYQIGASLGGPLVADRSNYFASLEAVAQDDVALVRPGGAFTGLADDVAHPFDQFLGFGSFELRTDDDRTLTFKLLYERYREENFRVGGVADLSYGQELRRDNGNLLTQHVTVVGQRSLNEARLQVGRRQFDEPPNSLRTAEWFSSGTTLQTGTNVLGHVLGRGEQVELRDTFHRHHGLHHLKGGGSVEWVQDRSRIDLFQEGLFVYLTDDRSLPISYSFGEGSSDVTADTWRLGLFGQDHWQLRPHLSVSLGLRYDFDTDANHPDFRHPLVPHGRSRDADNLQPRFGFSWDLSGQGTQVMHGGVGVYTGRYLLVPLGLELQQNGVSGRIVRRHLNGLLLGMPEFALDPADPENTGLPLPPDISLMASELEAPEALQASLGWTRQIHPAGLLLGADVFGSRGRNEIVQRDTNFGGNDDPIRPDPRYSQVNTFLNDGRSRHLGMILWLGGRLPGGHLLAASATVAERKNIADDFTPVFPFGFPSDPADIEAEYGRSQADEAVRLVASAVLALPRGFTVAPLLEYGSGQPWTRRLGYDFNGDGKNSDRAAGVPRNDREGPEFRQVSLRLTKTVALRGRSALDLIAEVFNLFDTTNLDVASVDGAQFLAGPTLADPNRSFLPNPNFGRFASTFPGREIQLGARLRF